MWWKNFKFFSPKIWKNFQRQSNISTDRQTEYSLFILIFRLLAKIRTQRNAGSNVVFENSWKYFVNTYLPTYLCPYFCGKNILATKLYPLRKRGWGEGGGDRTWDLSRVGRVLSFLMCSVMFVRQRRPHLSGHGRTSRLRFPEALHGRARDGVQRISRQ
jgi:hypothetical protein